MTKNQTKALLIIVILVLIGLAAVTRQPGTGGPDPLPAATGTAPTAGNTYTSVGAMDASNTPITTTPLPLPAPVTTTKVLPTTPPPPIHREVKAPAYLSPEAVKILQAKLVAVEKKLRADSTDALAWNDLGLYRKTLEDYEGAVLAWEYEKALAPTSVAAYHNLAYTYGMYLSQSVKAEQNWKALLVADTHYIPAYTGLHELYRYRYGAKAAEADKILIQGIAVNSKNTDLYTLLIQYYKEAGNIPAARTYLEKAITVAQTNKNTLLTTRLQSDLATLK